ncbi:Bug family tripartite tricarboxylate transporter substrate binding protein [Ferrovibrio sp.]|uniref:Bug family tripartite tricarboxylate transporter substrate binding protein n=1 Tax=Ferrovibrio sp. TaxID=1917215 RepID=UPI003D2783D9
MRQLVGRRAFIGGALSGAALLGVGGSRAQANYPAQPIRMIVGFAPGGSLDAMARLMAAPMSEFLGQPVIVENRTGASGNLAAEYVAKSKPDGYTMLFTGSGGMVVNPVTYATINFDPLKDFTHLGAIGYTDILIAVHPSIPATTVSEFVELTKKNPTKYKYGTSGAGNTLHVCLELFKQRSGAQIEGVHYRGMGPMLADFMSNQVQIAAGTPIDFLSQIKSGALRGLLMMAPERNSTLPEVPSAIEVGLPELNRRGWFGWHGPAGIPQPIVEKIRAAFAKGLATPMVSERLQSMGVEMVQETQQDFVRRIEDSLATYREIARSANIRIE